MVEKIIQDIEQYINKLKSDSLLIKRYGEAKKVIKKEKMVDDDFNDIILKSPFNNDEKNTLNFIFSVLYNLNLQLDVKQSHVLSLFNDYIEEQIKKENNEELIQKAKDLCISLNDSYIFQKFRDLNDILSEMEVSKIDRLNIIKELIEKNYVIGLSNNKQNSYNNDENELIKIFKKYNLDYMLLKNEYKELLKTKVNILKIDNILNLLFKLSNSFVSNLFSFNQQLFTKMLIYSNVQIINHVISILKENNINPIDFISDHPNVLIPNKNGFMKTYKQNKINLEGQNDDGEYNNLVENIDFFKSIGFNIKDLVSRCVSVLLFNSKIIKSNYKILNDVYGIDIKNDNNMALTCLINGESIKRLDRFIEITVDGYDYIINNRSRIFSIDDTLFYLSKIKTLYSKIPDFKSRFDSSKFININAPIFIKRGGNLYINQCYIKPDLDKLSIEDAKRILEISDKKNFTYERFVNENLGSIDCIDTGSLESNKYYKQLESKYKDGEFRYIINDTIISRIKFLRICTLFNKNNIRLDEETIRFALGYNSILSFDDVKNINDFLNSIQFKRECDKSL